MNQAVHNKIVSFIWSIADDCLRDVYVRGKYRDVILPMVVLRRLDALLEPTKDAVAEEVKYQKENGEHDPYGLEQVTKYRFYNTSEWTMQKLRARVDNDQKRFLKNWEAYLDGFSDNVKEIIDKFNLRNRIRHMAEKDVLLDVLQKFTSDKINLTPFPKTDNDGRKLPPLDNLGMGYVFEELIRKFNEENNEEAGEHFTPREVIQLMTHLLFAFADKKQLNKDILIYDPACGSGGMLTESQNFIKDEEGKIKAKGAVHLYGKEINDETYAICKSDMMIKGNSPENIRVGSTLATDEFYGLKFDFMLSNPPYGKSWTADMRYIKDKKEVIDPRFVVTLTNYWGESEEVDATPRSSDGQLLFLMEMASKMKNPDEGTFGTRIASVHNGSSLFTGDAGGGESNIRRYLLENDLLDAIVQLPNNLFYNTGITTYIWLLNNNKPKNRKGKVILIDASQRYAKLRKNLGAKNCELKAKHITEIEEAFLAFKEVKRKRENGLAAQVFNASDFGYYKVTIDRPARLKAQFTAERIAGLRYDKGLFEPMEYAHQTYGNKVYTDLKSIAEPLLEWCEKNDIDLTAKKRVQLTQPDTWEKQKNIFDAAHVLLTAIGTKEYSDFNAFAELVNTTLAEKEIKLSAAEKNQIFGAVSWYDETAAKVVKKTVTLKGKKGEALLKRLKCKPTELPDFGYYPTGKKNEYVLYENQTDLRDTENVPITENIHAYFLREVKPHVEEAWIDLEKTKIGYEISFNKYFYQHKPLRSIEEVSAEILALEQESEGLIMDILNVG